MQKILFTFLISLTSGSFLSIALIALSIRVFSSLFFGFFLSDIIMISMYSYDIVTNSNNDDLFYVFFYIISTIGILIASGMYILIRNNSDRCICKCCIRNKYEEIISSYYGK